MEIWMTKDELRKPVSSEDVKAKLKSEGWKVEGEVELDRDALKAEADVLGLEYAKNLSTERLADLVAAAKAE